MSNDKRSPTARGQRLRALREFVGMTRSELSELAQIGASSIKYWEDGKSSGLQRKPAAKIIKALQPIIECSYNWLYDGIGKGPAIREENSLELENQTASLSTFPNEIKPEIDAFRQINPDSLIIRITNNDLYPIVRKNDTVGGVPIDQGAWLDNIGEICFYQISSVNHIGIINYTHHHEFLLQKKFMYHDADSFESISDEQRLYKLVWIRKYNSHQ